MKKSYAQTAIGNLHYCSIGQGEVVVLLPPSGRSCMVYADLMQSLAKQYAVIGLDPPGCGPSDRLPPNITIEDIAKSLDEALQALGIPNCNVFGLHSGNKLATALAVASPDRVRKLAIAGLSHSLVPDPLLRRQLFLKYVPEVASGPKTAIDHAGLLNAWIAKYRELTSLFFNDEIMAGMTSVEASTDRLTVIIDYIQGMASKQRLYEANLTYGFERALASLRVPTLILEMITPEEEDLIGRQGPQLQAIIKRSCWIALEEPNLSRPTFEHRARDIRDALVGFFSRTEAAFD